MKLKKTNKEFKKTEDGYGIVVKQDYSKKELTEEYDKAKRMHSQAVNVISQANKFIKENKDLILTEEDQEIQRVIEKIEQSKQLEQQIIRKEQAEHNIEETNKIIVNVERLIPELKRKK